MKNKDIQFMENSLPFWKDLSAIEKNILSDSLIKKNYKKGSIIGHSENECTGFLMVKSGQLRVYSHSQEGKQITLYRLLEMDSCIFSASCMLRNINFEISIDIEKDSEIFIIPADIFDDISSRSLAVKSFTLDLVSSRFSDVMWIFEQYVFTNMASRLSGVLLDQVSLSGSDELNLTHEHIARELGTAREVITRLLKQFQTDKLLRISRNKVEIIDKNGLKKIHGD
ncbi:Crp/Fnr family transcriptional regulator [Proteocatella sphenisci]|uniref:Crp/Fnr family transcriptional regulator n=1 Tax=Proteocatella sphenisci TaxID=181070 RepID=UPI0004B666D6|nr:Crp/Fnr family transcriptional regulator [Proteocatella sphenisci]